jgi:hypothetical protein
LLTALTCKERDMGMFDTSVNYDAMPIGSVLQSPINLEKVTDGKWIALDGRDMNRSDAPELAPHFPAGVFTSTARTLARAPAAAVITVGTHTGGTAFVAGGLAGVQPLQASDDGVSWVDPSSTWAASTQWNSVIWANNRLVMAGSGGDAATPYVSVIGAAISAATLIGKGGGNTVATTGGTTTTLTQGLAYSPTLGRTVLIPNGAGTTIYTLDDGATAWTSRSHTTSRTKAGVVWTGSKYVVPCTDNYSYVLSSSDGITWAETALQHPLSSVGSVDCAFASDGNGTVVIANYAGASAWFVVSKDHGSTWRKVVLPMTANMLSATGLLGVPGGNVRYVNDKFIYSYDSFTPHFSTDGLSWIPMNPNRGAGGVYFRAWAFKSGVYCSITPTGTAANTYTEDLSKFCLPLDAPNFASNSANGTNFNGTQKFIKARN